MKCVLLPPEEARMVGAGRSGHNGRPLPLKSRPLNGLALRCGLFAKTTAEAFDGSEAILWRRSIGPQESQERFAVGPWVAAGNSKGRSFVAMMKSRRLCCLTPKSAASRTRDTTMYPLARSSRITEERYARRFPLARPTTFSIRTFGGLIASIESNKAGNPSRGSRYPSRLPAVENGWQGGPAASNSTEPRI